MTESLAKPHGIPHIFYDHLVNELGVSPDITIVHPVDCIEAVATALTEHHRAVVTLPPPNRIPDRYAELRAQAQLPRHLIAKTAFARRYNQLVQPPTQEAALSEIRIAVTHNRHKPAPATQRNFESTVTQLYSQLLKRYLQVPDMRHYVEADTPVGLYRQGRRTFLKTGDELEADLPRKHAGVIQCAPRITDTCARLGEAHIPYGWQNVALLSSHPFDEELSRTMGQDFYGLPPDSIFATGDGIPNGISRLGHEMRARRSWRRGFGAFILANMYHLDEAEIDATIDAAPELLTRGGVLLINDFEQFPDSAGTVEHMIDRARSVFRTEPRASRPTVAQGGTGRQAIFVKE